ncbi:MAG: C1 family peptidase, partial [Flammeovirgaceae bacterium]
EDDDDDLTKRNLANNPINHRNLFNIARNQGRCGSCWAFATTGVIEGNLSKKSGKLIKYLSPQQLVDCDTKNSGCNGGSYSSAFEYVKAKGLEFDVDYPYKAREGSCKYSSSLSTNKVTGWKYCASYSSSSKCSFDKVYALLVSGPLAVAIDGSVIQNYKSGIFTG